MDIQEKRAKWHKWYKINRDVVLERRRNSSQKKTAARQYREKNHSKLSKIYRDYVNTLHGRLMVLLKKCKHRGLICTITYDDLVHLWELQNGKCAITGIEMTTDLHFTNVSVDRISSSAGYSIDNVRLVCWWVNIARNILTDDEFIEKCKAVIKTAYPLSPFVVEEATTECVFNERTG